LDLVWDKPVIVFYKERLKQPESKAFAVIKARRLTVIGEKDNFVGSIEEFFPLMGDIDYVSTDEGKSDKYIICWFDDKEDDFSKSWRRLTTVTFKTGITFTTDKKGKRSYKAAFKAKRGKFESKI